MHQIARIKLTLWPAMAAPSFTERPMLARGGSSLATDRSDLFSDAAHPLSCHWKLTCSWRSCAPIPFVLGASCRELENRSSGAGQPPEVRERCDAAALLAAPLPPPPLPAAVAACRRRRPCCSLLLALTCFKPPGNRLAPWRQPRSSQRPPRSSRASPLPCGGWGSVSQVGNNFSRVAQTQTSRFSSWRQSPLLPLL